MKLNERERFFYDRTGLSLNHPAVETEGRERSARELAAAEIRLINGPYFIDVEPDDQSWDGDGDDDYDGPLWTVTLYGVAGSDQPKPVATLGGVACERDDPYIRVVSAELALDIPEEG